MLIIRKKRLKKLRFKLISFNKIRLFFFKSNQYIYIYIIDDNKKKILFNVSTYKFKNILKNKRNLFATKLLGFYLLNILKQKNINNILFDKSGYKFHGHIKTIFEILKENKIYFK